MARWAIQQTQFFCSAPRGRVDRDGVLHALQPLKVSADGTVIGVEGDDGDEGEVP